MPFLTLNKAEQRKVSLFFTCLGLAVVLWLFFALSNQYDYQIRTNVRYTNFPQHKAFHPLQSDTVSLNIKGTGWQLLFSRILNLNSINVNLQKLNSRNYITFTEQLSNINKQFTSSQKVVSVSPDTLYFDFSSRSVKKVPVRLAYHLSFKPQYGISARPRINPAYVVVTGAKEDLKNISYWMSDSINLADVSANVSAHVALMRSPQPNISVYPNSVDVKMPVDEFTENVVEVPLKVLNNKSYNLKLLPDKVKITFMTALSNFQKSTPESFEASLDLNGWKERGYQQLPVRVLRVPKFCKIVSIEPQVVDFIFKD